MSIDSILAAAEKGGSRRIPAPKRRWPRRALEAVTFALAAVGPIALSANDVVISEILASNANGLRDDDGDFSDWIEILNRGETTQDLGGWHLTDDPVALSRWRFPAIELAPGEAIVVFASGKDRASSGAPLHASFELDRQGEFLALVRPDGKTVAHALSPRFAPQRRDISYGMLDDDPTTFVYFLSPTPGAPNGGEVLLGFAPNVVSSAEHGFFDEPFEVSLSTTDPAAEIRFTLDGSVPEPGSSPLYEKPIRIETTTILRARAFRDGHGPSDVTTRSYIFPEDVVRQDGTGFPPSWGGVAADYEMDPNVANAPAYRDTIVEDLLTIPSLSIVLPIEDLFGPRGIYSNTEGRGPLWERACSIELIHPDGAEGFQVDCGIRIFGYGWRPHSATMKHSFRLVFSSDYGPGKLRHPFFPGWPVEVFDDIVLRAQGSRGWNDFRESIIHTQYIRDAWARYTARDMGKLTTQSTYVHLYLNGLYWGLYNPVERPDAQFLVNHLGGEREDYDALNARVGTIEVIDGSRAAWDRVMALSRSDVTRPEVWGEIRELVDLPDLVSYMLVQFYTGNRDWPGSNGNNMRVAGGPDAGIGLKSFLWDMEYSIWNATDNVLNVATQYDTPATLHARLRANVEYRTLFGDLAHRHLTGNGALTPERAAARWLDRAQEIDRAIVGESARWGDRRREPPYTRDVEWVRERDRLLGQFFPQRTGVLLEQLRAASLYPRVDAPRIAPEGGLVSPGAKVVLSAPLGQVYYTLDGSDPRLPGGEVSPGAREFGVAHRSVLLPEGAAGRFFVPVDDSLESDWFAFDFDDSAWRPVTLGVGFDRSSGYEGHIATDVGDDMFRVNSSAWLRVPFDIDESEELEIERLFLRAKYDDGFHVWLNGESVASRNAPEPMRWNSQATASHGDAAAIVFEVIEVSEAVSLLRPGRNVLAVQLLNTSQANADLLFSVELEGSAPSAPGEAIVIDRSTRLLARALLSGQWSALEEAVFVSDETPPLRITEILYHPPDDFSPAGFEADDYEWIEIQNIGDAPWDAGGARLGGGVRFELPRTSESVFGPGEIALVVKSEAAFHRRYGTEAKILGEYEGRLSNAGDRIVLEGAFGEPIHDFSYADSWYPETDGQGASLEVIDRTAPLSSWSLREHWRPSSTLFGTPGEPIDGPPRGGLVLPSDANGDARLDLSDPVRVLAALFLGDDSAFPCDDGTISSAGNSRVLDANGDGDLHLSDAVYVLTYLFQGGPPPVEGTACVRVEGCPNVCAN